MNKLLKISTLLLAVAATVPVSAQQQGAPTRVQGEALREQRDEGNDRDERRKPLPVASNDRHPPERSHDRQGSRDGRDWQRERDGNSHRDGRYSGQPYGNRNDRDDNRRDDGRHRDNRYHGNNDWAQRHDRRDDRRDWRHDRRDDRRDWRDDRRRYASYRYRSPYRYVYPRGYRHYNWSVGYYLPAPYYSSHYYVDYGYYRLPPPPRGYRWIRVDNDVYLVAIGSGLIRDILYGLFY